MVQVMNKPQPTLRELLAGPWKAYRNWQFWARDWKDADYESEAEKAAVEALRAYAKWIYRNLEAEYEYRQSDEAVDEDIMANEYEFYEDGEKV